MDTLLQDLRQSLRLIRKRPGFTAAIILSIALGVGANTAIFSVTNTLLLRPLPFPDGHQLMRLFASYHPPGRDPRNLSMGSLAVTTIREQAPSFESTAGWLYESYNLVGGSEPVQVYGAATTANAAEVLGLKPLVGRYFLPEEDRPGSPASVVVLSHSVWQNSFGSDPEIVGRSLKINDAPYSVVGVMPPLYEYPYQSKIWIPLGLDPSASTTLQGSLNVVSRLKPGMTEEAAAEELKVISDRLRQEFPEAHTDVSLVLMPLREDLVTDLHSKKLVLMLMAGAGFLLLIACANVANMLLSRSLEQSGEIAIRTALGVSNSRLLRQFLTQGIFLSLLGGAVGVVLAYWIFRPLVSLNPYEDINVIFSELTLDYRVLGFTFLLSILVGALFSLVPALRMSRSNLQSLLMEGSRTTTNRSGRRIAKAMIVIEVAVAVMLLVGSGLMLKSLHRLQTLDVGIDSENLLVLRITPSQHRYPDLTERADYLERILDRVETLPGVVSATTDSLYPHRNALFLTRALPEGRPADDPESFVLTIDRTVSRGFVETMGLQLLKGRTLGSQDRADTEPVVLISESLAKEAWPGEDPLDRRIRIISSSGADFPWMRVVGVVNDVIINDEYTSAWYIPYSQIASQTSYVDIVVRTAVEPLSLTPAVRQAIWAIDEEQGVSEVATAEQLLIGEFWNERSGTLLMAMFAGVGLLLTIVGVYGIQAYSVVQQSHEMGLRMVFGARPKDVVMAALRQGMMLSLAGLAIGLVGAWFLTRFLGSLLYEVSPTDMATFASITAITLVIAFIANYLPARKATQVDPVDIIRY